MADSQFVHLHLHTQYSLLDGAIRLKDLFVAARDMKMPAVAVTDHGNVFGALDFFLQAKEAGIKPIIGCEVYVAPGSYTDREAGSAAEKNNHLVLLVENEQGYRNLNRLLTHAHLEGFYYKPRVDKELLSRYSAGLTALSACLKGEIASKILRGDERGAMDTAGVFSEIYPGRFFLELMENGIAEQRKVNRVLIEMARRLSLPIVATNDCHYMKRADAAAHEALLCIQTGKTISDPGRIRMTTDEFYVKSPEEMIRAFSELPEAITNTLVVAERCTFAFSFGTFQFPEYRVPEGEDINAYFEKEVRQGFDRRSGKLFAGRDDCENTRRLYLERLEKETVTIKRMGFAGYFLIVADFINYAKTKCIPVGPGRGSAAGSLVAYSLGITDIDPLAYDLLFERFLNPERISMPDIDIDFCRNGRDEVIRYVSEKYGGQERVAQIITFGKMQARAVVRDVGRVLDMSYPEVDKIAKLIPTMPLNITLEDAVKTEPRLRELIESDQRIARLIEIARSLEGLNRHSSTHAAGMVISNRPLVDYMALTRGQKGEVVTQFDMKGVEKLGLIKFDFLGLKTLTVIDHAIHLIRDNRGEDIDISSIPLDDKKTYQLFQSGNTDGVFQLEGSGMKDLMVRLIPEKFEEIIALVALYRPGPLNTGMTDEYIKRKHSQKAIRYELPQLKEILTDTYGVMVYQEQVMQIAIKLADFTTADSDLLRRAMGKKIREEMARQREKFVNGAIHNKIDPKKAEKIFTQMEEFAEYGFNKSHSAAYAMVAYRTAYLKAHYPVEFMAALLTSEMDDTDKIMKYMGECRDMGIEVAPPHVNESGLDFTVSGDVIRFGLKAVKNVGESAIESILDAKQTGGPFASLFDFSRRVDLRRVNKRVVESLVKCGAFDCFGRSRSRMMAAADRAMETGQNHQEDLRRGQMSIFDHIRTKDSPAGPEADFEEDYPDVPDWSDQITLANEKESLGFYITGHPLTQHLNILKTVATCDSVSIVDMQDKSPVVIGGIVAAIREIITKKGDRMAFVTLEDTKGLVETVVFADTFAESREYLAEDTPILMEGNLDKGEESAKVIVRKITPLSKVPQNGGRSVYIEVNDLDLPEERIAALRELIEKNRGGSRVFLRICNAHECVTISLPEKLTVDPTDGFIKAVGEIFYDGSVNLA
ncbi:MAG: DNA polymerase III subunit alpha [Deltaproteobacteria bacterium]|nr:DNA polymerase III subunit alpha [Candidatus Zymogenaceae bacterium]